MTAGTTKTDYNADEIDRLVREGACHLIRERNSGPGKGTPCGKETTEKIHGIWMCAEHAAEVKRANGIESNAPDPIEAVRLARSVIDKYGADADKPSVHLAKALLAGAHNDCASLVIAENEVARLAARVRELETEVAAAKLVADPDNETPELSLRDRIMHIGEQAALLTSVVRTCDEARARVRELELTAEERGALADLAKWMRDEIDGHKVLQTACCEALDRLVKGGR